MKEYTHSLREYLAKGLTPLTTTPRNTPSLGLLEGMYPEDGSVVSLVDVQRLITDTLDLDYPYPQILELVGDTLVCGPDKIWAYRNGAFEVLVEGLVEGSLWTYADYQTFVVLTNGSSMVVREATTQEYYVYPNIEIPPCGCVCSNGAQLIVGSPDTASLEYQQFTREHVWIHFLNRLVNVELAGQYIW